MKKLNTKLFALSLMFIGTSSFAEIDYKALKLDYIEQYRTTAIQQMIHTKIPASITLAQGLLESGAGTSRLATKGNNHFGIKCHDWKGDYMFHDDDLKGECFRVYQNAELSFVDHSDFLTNRGRYSFLFGYSTTDYESWAKGLKKAGYATNPQYANILIKLIREYNLDDFDATINIPSNKNTLVQTQKNKFANVQQTDADANAKAYVNAPKCDGVSRTSMEFSSALSNLKEYAEVKEAEVVNKKTNSNTSADNAELKVVAQQNQTLESISNDLGIKLKKLVKRNPSLERDQVLEKGTVVYIE